MVFTVAATMIESKKIIVLRIAAIVLLLLNGLNALAAGYSFITQPDGRGLGMTTAYLRHSPFTTFFIPGLIKPTLNILFVQKIFLVVKLLLT